jgi:uncharacterized iron-regulated membrane protein
MRLRKFIFWLHLFTGIVAGSVVMVMSVTGVALAFERQWIEWADRDLRVAPAAARLPISTLVANACASEPGTPPSGMTMRSDPGAPAAINLGRERTIFVNPYTGAVLGEGSKPARAFFRFMTDLHRWLGTTDERHAIGRSITGACNLAFLFLVLSGFYLWWPRKWTRSAGHAILVPKLGLRGKARDFNWHNAIGFWSAPVLFFLVLTGVLLSYSWAGDLVYRLTGSEPPPARAGAQRAGPAREGNPVPDEIDRLWRVAEEREPDWQSISARFTGATEALTFTIDRGNRDRPDRRSQLTLDPQSAAVVRWEPFSSYNLGRQLRVWGRFIHTGEAGGVIGQTVAALASAGAAVLVWTGFALAWRRYRGRQAKLERTS